MNTFVRDDGCPIEVVPGYAGKARPYRPSVNPKSGWSDVDYREAATTRLQRWQKRRSEFTQHMKSLEGARVLEVGCGSGIDSLLMSLEPVRSVVGIDLQPRLIEQGVDGDRIRKLAEFVLQDRGETGGIDECLRKLPIRFLRGDATRLPFDDNSFDFLWSRTVLEHLVPPGKFLQEMARVVKPGGVIYHLIDPFYWFRGCHKRGVVDIPWAHARLTLDEYCRFVTESEGETMAARRRLRLETLNRLTLRQWREVFEKLPQDILGWEEEERPFAADLLKEYPQVTETLLDGVDPRDLTHAVLKVWLQNPHPFSTTD